MSESTSMAMPEPENGAGISPFGALRHVDAFGREYWLAREIQPIMGYPLSALPRHDG
jgi:hypothetical protein